MDVDQLIRRAARNAAGDPEAAALFECLRPHFYVSAQTGHLVHFVVFGSFVTSKLEPNDVDVFMIMDDTFEYGRLGGARLLFEHGSLRRS